MTADVDDPAELDSPDWVVFDLIYKAGKHPIVVECNRDKGADSLAREECIEFDELLEDLEDSQEKRHVIEHLKNTRSVIACQLLSDIDEDGYDANGEFLAYFVEHCGGMIQADGEGFYEGSEVVVPLK